MSNPLNYTIGWICATETGFIAAQAFLDQTHPRHSPLSKIDTNAYVLGSMGNHNVVITVLPPGKADAVNAARTGTLLRRSFLNVEVALFIGTAGGAPTERNDIRLGDVVVSFPGDGHTGVFQWDFGKAIQGQPFLNTRVLNQPPDVLLQAASQLEAKYEETGPQLQQYIDTVLLAHPELRKGGYERPKNSSDRLYLPQVVHPAGHDLNCWESCGDDPAKLIQRSPRRGGDSDPRIHHGLIASGNTFIDRAKFRDELVAKNGVLCFEKEAAGLMNTLPCMAICGISNYADTHVNKDWEAYAAMAATAYAKDMLQCVPPFHVGTMTGPESNESCAERRELARFFHCYLVCITGFLMWAGIKILCLN